MTTSAIHSVYFMDDKWTPTTARAWLKKEGLKPSKGLRREGSQLRYNIIPKEKFASFSTKITKDGVHLVIGYYKKPASTTKPTVSKKVRQKGGSGLVGYWDALRPTLQETNWLSQTAQNFGDLPMTPSLLKALSVVASQGLRHSGY